MSGVTASGVLAAAAVAGTAMSAMNSVQQGKAANAQAQQQAELYRREGEQRRLASEAQAESASRQASREQGTLRARVGGSGVTMEGTPLMVAEDFASESELQRQRILHGGIMAEDSLQNQAALTSYGGKAAQRAGYLRGGATLLQGVGWYGSKMMGPGGGGGGGGGGGKVADFSGQGLGYGPSGGTGGLY